MRKLLVAGSVAFVGLILSACADPAATCAGYGFKPGTNEYANCQMAVNERNRATAASIAAASSNMGVMNRPVSTPTTTNCRRHRGGVTCNTF